MSKRAKQLRSLLLGGAHPRVRAHILLITHFRETGHPRLARWVAGRLERKHGVLISPNAEVPRSVDFRHPIGVVIGKGVRLGERVIVFQNVTIGGARIGDWHQDNFPEVGDDTVIFAGAVVVGKVKIGKRCIVGANAVVTEDVPDYCTVAGVPARVIRTDEPTGPRKPLCATSDG